jgi:hypothetical protein
LFFYLFKTLYKGLLFCKIAFSSSIALFSFLFQAMEISSSVNNSNNDSTSFVYGDIPTYARIELPCFVSSAQKGLETLGGQGVVCNALRDSGTSLQFRFSPNEPSKPSLSSSSVHTNGFLLRIRRRKASNATTDESPSEAPTIEVVGSVNQSFVFTNPADYQV